MPATTEQVFAAEKAEPQWGPEQELPGNARWFSPPIYGLTTYADLSPPRQLVALTTFAALVSEGRRGKEKGRRGAGIPDDSVPLAGGGKGAQAYADAIATYVAFPIGRAADYWSSTSTWYPANQQISHLY